MLRKVLRIALIALLIIVTALVSACGTKQYELTTAVEPAGAGSVSPSGGTHNAGTSVTVTATPNSGYVFERWSGDVSGTLNSQTIKMDADKNITAHFVMEEPEAMKYTVEVSVSPDGTGAVSPAGGTYEEGTEITLTATPETGYIFKGWGGDAFGSSSTITVTVDGDKNITAYFDEKPVVTVTQYALTTSVEPAGAGSVSPSGGLHNQHAKVTVTATSNEGYAFHHWSGDASGTEPSVSFTMDSDMSVTAHFEEVAEFSLTSTAFTEGADIPVKYSCDGQDISPELSWAGVPFGTESFVLIMDDPDAPNGVFTHWVIYNIPADVRTLNENILKQQELSDGTRQGINNFATYGYGGPCPPIGQKHEYRFFLYALDTTLDIEPYAADKNNILNAIQDHILGQVQLSGYYQS